jgi:PAS domain S-box-containing protein
MGNRGSVLYVGSDSAADRLDGMLDGRTVRATTSVGDALELLADGGIDCVVSAYQLPEGDEDGLALLSRIRETRPTLPFVLAPSSGSEALASEAIGAGVTDYVPASADPDRLARAVTDAVADRTAADGRCPTGGGDGVVERVVSALVGARTIETIDRQVCETVATTDPYVFAWIGEYDEADGRIVPRASAGFEGGYLETIEITADDGPLGMGPTGRAVDTRRLQVVQDTQADETYEPWWADAAAREYRSSAAVPLVHDETLYGVLNVYADRTDVFDDEQTRMLTDLADSVAVALHRVRIQEQSTAQYRELFEDAPVMVALTRDAPEGPIIADCNRRFAAKLGWSIDALQGRPLTDVYTDQATAKLEGENGYELALEGEFATTERTLRTRDGTLLHTLLQATPRQNADGDIVGTQTLYVDVTERRRAREVLEQAEAMAVSMDGMAIIDDDGTYVYANQAQADIYGYDDPDALVGEPWDLLYDEAVVERFESEIHPALAGGAEWRGEVTGVRADGSTFPQELSLSSLSDGRYICVTRDITERRRYERRLERQRDNLEILNQVVRHDIRNDLQITLGYAETLRDFLGADETASHHVEQVVNSARDAVEITETAGDVAKVMLTADTETRPVSVRHVLSRQIDEVRSAYANVVMTTDGAIPDVDVPADDMLGSVFRNLLKNAVEHNDGPIRTVTVSATDDGDTVTVRIADDGPGVPDERKDTIFREGEKGLDSEGTGLGLYLVETLVDRYGGTVRVQDNEPTGAVFSVELPLTE